MKRDEFTKGTKREAYERQGGRCAACGLPVKPGQEEYDHEKPAYFFGDARPSNCRLLCRGCHRDKTATEDMPAIAKSRRLRNREAGIKRKSKFQTSRAGPFKAKIGGGIVKR